MFLPLLLAVALVQADSVDVLVRGGTVYDGSGRPGLVTDVGITKVDVRTGTVIWRLGGRRNQFTFLDTPMPAFSSQHGARAYGPGSLLLLDNLGDPNESRAERYTLDEASMTARLVHSYGSAPGVVTQIGGSTQPLPDGRTLVSFGTAGRVEEFDASGRVVWQIQGNAGYVFRAQRIPSLYSPGLGGTR